MGAKYSGSTLEEKRTYNALGQMTAMEVTQGGATTLAITNGYAPNSNNGNLLWQRTAVTPQLTYEQHYGYDAANRLRIVTEGADNGSLETSRCADIQPTWPAGTWCTRYGYDGFGNLWTEEAVNALGVKPFGSAWYLQGSSTVTNRMKNVGYDAARNLVEVNVGDKLTFGDYDGENQLRRIRAKASAGAPDTQDTVVSEYFYDGNGRRVKRKWGSVETFYIYGTEGELIAEYGSGSSGSTGGGAEFLFADHLGSTRLKIGSDTKRWDYEPFGRVISRTGNGYGVDDALTQGFTGKERDQESGLDYFGARYYGSALGRWTSPDPSALVFADPTDPQSLNLCSYVRNAPMARVDPNGEFCYSVNHTDNTVTVDNQSTTTSETCTKSGGTWIDGTATSSWYGSDGVLQIGYSNGNQAGTLSFPSPDVSTDNSGQLQNPWMIDLSDNTKHGPGGDSINAFLFSQAYLYQPRILKMHWCGPGGGGPPTSPNDVACRQHDLDYARAGASAAMNTGAIKPTAAQIRAMKVANQKMYNAVKANSPEPSTPFLLLWLRGYIPWTLAPGTAVQKGDK